MELKLALVVLCGVLVVAAVLGFALGRAHKERAALEALLTRSIATTDRVLTQLEDALQVGDEALTLCAPSASNATQPNREQAKNKP